MESPHSQKEWGEPTEVGFQRPVTGSLTNDWLALEALLLALRQSVSHSESYAMLFFSFLLLLPPFSPSRYPRYTMETRSEYLRLLEISKKANMKGRRKNGQNFVEVADFSSFSRIRHFAASQV